MTEDAEYEEYRNTLAEIVDGGGCVETMAAASELRGEGESDGQGSGGSPSRRDLLGSDALATGVAESVADVLAEVDAETARATLRDGYGDLTDVRAAFRATVDPGLFDALAAAGIGLTAGDLSLDPPVCLKTFLEADLDAAMTLVPEVDSGGVRDRVLARETVDGVVVTIHVLPDVGRSYAILDTPDSDDGSGDRRLVLPGGRTVGFTDPDRRTTGLDCDPDRTARTEYEQATVAVDGVDYVVETVCTTV